MSKVTVGVIYQAIQIAGTVLEAAADGKKVHFGQAFMARHELGSILRNCQIEIELPPDAQMHIANMTLS